MYKLSLNFPNLAKGAEVQIDGLGVFENGYEYDITTEEADAYRVHNQVLVSELDEEGSATNSVEPGPTLLQAFKSSKGVTVRKMTDKELKALEPEAPVDSNNDVVVDDTNPEGVGS